MTECETGESCYSIDLTLEMTGVKDGSPDSYDIEVVTKGFFCSSNASGMTDEECRIIEVRCAVFIRIYVTMN